MTHEVITKSETKTKRNNNGMVIRKMTSRAVRNLVAQQREYMRQNGEFIRRDRLAAILLETATLPKPE